jgi:glycosyltransferase involved in cell wall biosynthesis
MKKILFFNLYTGMGGGEYCLYHLMKDLDRESFTPILMVNAEGPLAAKTRAEGIQVEIAPFETVMLKHLIEPRVFFKNFRAAFAIRRFIRTEQIDIVHCADVLPLLLLLPAALTGRIRILYNVIFFHEPARAWLLDFFSIFMVKAVVADSYLIQDDLKKKTVRMEKKMSVIHHAVDADRFHPRGREERLALRAKFGLPADKRIIGLVARYDVWKGHDTFLNAVEALLRIREDLAFLIVGGATTEDVFPEVKKYKERIRARIAAIQPHERLLVWDERDDVPDIMAAMDVFVCPSDREPFGLVVLEAYATGLPIVVSTSVGALESLQGADEVFLAEAKNPGSFVWSIQKALEALAKRDVVDSIATARRISLVHKLNWEDYARRFEMAYAGLT